MILTLYVYTDLTYLSQSNVTELPMKKATTPKMRSTPKCNRIRTLYKNSKHAILLAALGILFLNRSSIIRCNARKSTHSHPSATARGDKFSSIVSSSYMSCFVPSIMNRKVTMILNDVQRQTKLPKFQGYNTMKENQYKISIENYIYTQNRMLFLSLSSSTTANNNQNPDYDDLRDLISHDILINPILLSKQEQEQEAIIGKTTSKTIKIEDRISNDQLSSTLEARTKSTTSNGMSPQPAKTTDSTVSHTLSLLLLFLSYGNLFLFWFVSYRLEIVLYRLKSIKKVIEPIIGISLFACSAFMKTTTKGMGSIC